MTDEKDALKPFDQAEIDAGYEEVISELKARVEKLREALGRIDKIQHSMPRDEHGAGEFYQARLSVAQDIANAALEADGGDE